MRIRKDLYATKLGVPGGYDAGFTLQRLCPFCGADGGNYASGHTDRTTGDANTRESIRRRATCNAEWVQVQTLVPHAEAAVVVGGIAEVVRGGHAVRLRKDLIAMKTFVRGGSHSSGRRRRLCPYCAKERGRPGYGADRNEPDREAVYEAGRYVTRFLWGCPDCDTSWWHYYCEDEAIGIVGVKRADA